MNGHQFLLDVNSRRRCKHLPEILELFFIRSVEVLNCKPSVSREIQLPVLSLGKLQILCYSFFVPGQ